jgi:Flp pilus assembly protein TadD/uncharacterized membrane protein YheB (UPF0754 family)
MSDPDRGPLQGIVKYNPHLWGDDELRSIFVARNRELAGLLDRLRQTPAGMVPQHVLVVGQRGMGKTTLLRRVALGVRDDAELSRQWIALTLPEKQFTVSTLAELWGNILDALIDTLETEGGKQVELLDRLDGEIRRIDVLPTLEREEATIGLLDDWINQHQRRILLLIDNTDLLFDNLGRSENGKQNQKAGNISLWRLRKTLTHHSGFFWLGASYQAMESGHLYSDAFHDFFELVELRPLSVNDMRQAMLALACTFGVGREKPGEAAVQRMAHTLDAKLERLKILSNLTDNNLPPAATLILYKILTTDRQDDLYTDIRLLLDLVTSQYQYEVRMENLADQPRKLLAHLMEHWAPMAAVDLAKASNIPVTTVSGQLTRLEAEGVIKKASLKNRRRTGYQVADRLFNIWYLMRYLPHRKRKDFTWFIKFMRLWYRTDELRALDNVQQTEVFHKQFPKFFSKPFDQEQAWQQALEKFDNDAAKWTRCGEHLLRNHPGEWVESYFRKAIEIDPKYLKAWNSLGDLLKIYLGRHEEAEEAYHKAIEIDPRFSSPWNGLGDLLQDHLGAYIEAEEAYGKARQLDPENPYYAANHARLLVRMDKRVEASATFRQAADLAAPLAKPEESADYWDILLQAHLYLSNQDTARQALEQLANRASNDDKWAFVKLREQAQRCHRIKLGPALAELMEQSPHASFLKLIALALRAAAGEAETLDGIPPELRTMAEEVMRDILAQDRKAVEG